jgi:hypothetical protein
VYRPYREADAALIAFRQWMREQFKPEHGRKRR